MPSYDVYSGDKSTLYNKITSTQTASIKISAMNINGALTGWANTAGVIEISEQSDSTLKREWVYYTGTSVDSTTKVCTLSGVVRGISSTTSDVTSGSTGIAFSKGATVRFVTFHDLLNKKANTDRANTFSAAQTIASGTKILFGGSGAYIYSSDSGTNLKFKDGSNSEVTLSTLSAGAGVDTKTRVSASDTTSGFLDGKLTGGDGISLTIGSPAADETLDIDVTLATDPGLEFSSGDLRVKASTGITRDSAGISVDTTATSLRAMSKWWGTGADGAKAITSSENLNPASDFNYTSFSLSSGQTMSVTSVNTPLMIRVQGDATINGTIDLNGKGGASGAVGSVGGSGTAGTAGASLVSGFTNTGGGVATTANGGRGGGGGASLFAVGTAGANSGGSAGAPMAANLQTWLANINLLVACGGGGSGAGGDDATANTGGAGGAGGGAMLMYIGGNLTLGASSVIRANGADGQAASDVGCGSGGAGGGGTVVIVVGGTITNGGVTATATGGTGGAVGSAGGNGGAGKVLIYSLADNTVIAA